MPAAIPLGLMFHHFTDGDVHPAGQGAITAERFRDILDYFDDRLLSAREWREKRLVGQLKDGEICLTFDDGLRCQFDIALPVLQARNLTAFWFPYTGPLAGEPDRLELYRYFRTVRFANIDAFYAAFNDAWNALPLRDSVHEGLRDFDPGKYLAEYPFYSDGDRQFRFIRDRLLTGDAFFRVMDEMLAADGFDADGARQTLWMDKAHLRSLHSDGHVVGLHSHTHPTKITALSRDRQIWELETNTTWLKQITGAEPDCMAYPCGDYDEGLLSLLRDQGIRLGFQSKLADTEGAMEIPRLDHAIALTNNEWHADAASR